MKQEEPISIISWFHLYSYYIINHDIAFDELGDVLDSMIETGGMSKEEYQAKVKNFVCSL